MFIYHCCIVSHLITIIQVHSIVDTSSVDYATHGLLFEVARLVFIVHMDRLRFVQCRLSVPKVLAPICFSKDASCMSTPISLPLVINRIRWRDEIR